MKKCDRVRWAAAVLVIILLWGMSGRAAFAAPNEEMAKNGEQDAAITEGVDQHLAGIDWGELTAVFDALPETVRALWEGYDLAGLTRKVALSGTFGTAGEDLETVWPRFQTLLREECGRVAGIMATLIGLSLISGFAGALTAGKGDGVHEAAGFVCRCFTLTVVLSAFSTAASFALTCVDGVCRCMELASPVLMTLLVAMGGTVSAGVFSPAMSLLAGGVAGVLKGIVLPLITCGGVLSLVSGLSSRVRLGEMGKLCNRTVKWAVGLVTTLYAAITALGGITASSYDGVAARTVKYVSGSLFPMVGGLVTGSFETVLGCAGLVKNAAGITAILLCVSIVLVPMLRICITMLALRLTAALVQPVAQKEQVAMCTLGAEMLSGLLSACAGIMAMFLVTLGLIVGVGNAGITG